jgi:hypothetical protein
MKKGTIIALTLSGLVLAGVGIGLYWHRRKKPNKKGDTVEVKSKTVVVNETYDKSPEIKKLKDSIGKVNYNIFTICHKGNDVMVDCNTGGKYSAGLVQGIWIQQIRALYKMESEFYAKHPSSSKIGKYGKGLITSLEATINSKFDPKYYNTNRDFYKEYLSRGGTPLKK